jgi:hypothetical protein
MNKTTDHLNGPGIRLCSREGVGTDSTGARTEGSDVCPRINIRPTEPLPQI